VQPQESALTSHPSRTLGSRPSLIDLRLLPSLVVPTACPFVRLALGWPGLVVPHRLLPSGCKRRRLRWVFPLSPFVDANGDVTQGISIDRLE